MDMHRIIRNSLIIIAATFITSACVSTGEFEKMQTAKDAELKTLAQQRDLLERNNVALQQQLAMHQDDKSALKQQIAYQEQDKTQLQQQLAASQQRQQQYDALVKSLSSEVEKGQLKVSQYQNMLSVDLAEQIFFDSGKATLKAGGKDVLKKVGDALKGYDNKVIRVVGHTDNVPLTKSLQAVFPTNWELSVARATNVVRYLQEVGIAPERMVASGRGEYDPVAPNDSAEGRQKNRRIEIMLIDRDLANEMDRSAK
jgi:chemotaxis protein MotB